MKNANLPIIGITMGDGAGVGPEVVVKALTLHPNLYEVCKPLVIGDRLRLETAAKILQHKGCIKTLPQFQTLQEPDFVSDFTPGTIYALDLNLLPKDLPFGKLSAICGDAAYHYIAKAVELASAKKIQAICTAPINKEALHLGGHHFPGHTELLATLTHTPEVSLMLSTPHLKVIHVTTHIGLIDAIERIDDALVERTITRAHQLLVKSGIPNPHMAVCGINPHAGENGLFGRGEEETKILPAIQRAQARGWKVEGPFPADTLFYRAGRGEFDIVVAMYHDQGHGPVKILGIENGVNVTVGLPIIRTSVDHGTAFDIAGTGVADEFSLVRAIEAALQLAA